MSQVEFRVGPQVLSDGSQQPPRLGRSGEVVGVDAHGRFHEAVYRGNVWTVSTALAGVTVAATADSPIASSTGKPILTLYNPITSTVNLSILRAHLATVSGTPGGPLAWNVCAVPASNALISTFVTTGVTNNKTFATTGCQAQIGNFVVLTGSTSACTMFRPIGGPAAIAAGAGMYDAGEETAGEILVAPGNLLCIAVTAVGTSHVIAGSITWEEVPV